MLTQFVNSAIVIDDKPEEVEGLIDVLNTQDIASQSYTPQDLKDIVFSKNRKLIFLDFSLDDSKKEVENVASIRSLLRKTLSKDFGIYGVVMWTNHIEHIDLLKDKIQEDKIKKTYPTPLFIVGLDKTNYIKVGNFNSLFIDIENVLKQDNAATFFLEWSNSVQQAQNTTVSKIYSLLPDYNTLSDDFTNILHKLALNYTGINVNQVGSYPLHIDAFKSFDDILHAELLNCQKNGTNPFLQTVPPFSNQSDLLKIYAQLNSALLIDENNIDQSKVIPGNVYEIKDINSKFKRDEAIQNVKNIVVELTPPCDFSNSGKRIRARVIGGFLTDLQITNTNKTIDQNVKKQLHSLKCESDFLYKEVYPIIIPGNSTPQLLILDFRYFGSEEDAALKNASKYEILFRVKPKLFADILQKFSAHAARLGLFIIHS